MLTTGFVGTQPRLYPRSHQEPSAAKEGAVAILGWAGGTQKLRLCQTLVFVLNYEGVRSKTHCPAFVPAEARVV